MSQPLMVKSFVSYRIFKRQEKCIALNLQAFSIISFNIKLLEGFKCKIIALHPLIWLLTNSQNKKNIWLFFERTFNYNNATVNTKKMFLIPNKDEILIEKSMMSSKIQSFNWNNSVISTTLKYLRM